MPAALADGGGHEAGGFGVAPSDLHFGPVVRGEPVQRSIEVQNGADAPARVSLAREGALAESVQTTSESFVVGPRERLRIDLVLVPKDLPNGPHEGAIVVTQAPQGNVQQGSGVNVALAVRVRLGATVGGEERVDVRGGGLHVPDAEAGGTLAPSLVLENHGNVRAWPRARVTLATAQGEPLSTTEHELAPLLPGTTRNDTVKIPAPPAPGQHRVTFTLLDRDREVVTESRLVDVAEAGSLRRRVEMGPIATADLAGNANHRLPAGKPLLVQVPVRNVGEADAEPRFAGYVLKDGDIVRTLRSEALPLLPGERGTLSILLDEPLPAGSYLVRGKVHYGDRVTEEHETVLNVEASPAGAADSPGADSTNPTPGAGATLALVAACLAAAAARRLRRDGP